MAKIRDLTGMKFGRLTVVRRVENKNKRVCWECECNCGKITEVLTSGLTSGQTKSCGCLNREIMKNVGKSRTKNIVGKKFNRLIVIERVENDKRGCIQWLCKCDCGNTIKVRSGRLASKEVQSCGCLLVESALENRKNTLFKSASIQKIKLNKVQKNNTSGFKGVYFVNKKGKWTAEIGVQGEVKRLGHFDNKEDAIQARKDAEELYFKPLIEEFNNKEEI